MEAAPAPNGNARRSTRLRWEMTVLLTSLNSATQEHCQTVVVNPQGCGLRTSCEFQPGTLVRLAELPGNRTVTGVVANCVPLGNEGMFWLVGIALDEPENVWGIEAPPADWQASPSQAASAAAASAPAHKPWRYSEFAGQGKPVWKK